MNILEEDWPYAIVHDGTFHNTDSNFDVPGFPVRFPEDWFGVGEDEDEVALERIRQAWLQENIDSCGICDGISAEMQREVLDDIVGAWIIKKKHLERIEMACETMPWIDCGLEGEGLLDMCLKMMADIVSIDHLGDRPKYADHCIEKLDMHRKIMEA